MTYQEKIRKLTNRLEREVAKLLKENYMTTAESLMTQVICSTIRIAAMVKDNEVIPEEN